VWVATSRLYRGMHHPTDVLGSVLLAACWLTATSYFVRPNRDLKKRPPRPPSTPSPRTESVGGQAIRTRS
jgi:undecaprenyl-diphosphatase